MSSVIDICVAESRNPDSVRYDVRFEYERPAGKVKKDTIWFVVEGDLLPERIEVVDFAVLSLLPMAMRLGCDMRVHGAVSRRLLANLEEFQTVWKLWWPDVYQPVAIRPDREADATTIETPKAVSAFSGGVDSCFTMLRHSQRAAGRGSREIAAALMLHGFDIPLDEAEAFRVARENARLVLTTIGMPISVLATNWREVVVRHWEAEFCCGLAACLHLFRGHTGAGLIGSETDYAHLVLPSGSNPMTNRLLSSGDFEIVYDGAGFTRSDKVALIARWPVFADNLRVCWEDPTTGVNCGRCEKCLRTQLNFLAVGQSPGAAFPSPLRPRTVLGLRARNRMQLGYLKEIRATAQQHGIGAPWVRCLEACIARDAMLLSLRESLKRIPWFRAAYSWARTRLARGDLARGPHFVP